MAKAIDSKLEFRQTSGTGISSCVSSTSVDHRETAIIYEDEASLASLARVVDGLNTSICREPVIRMAKETNSIGSLSTIADEASTLIKAKSILALRASVGSINGASVNHTSPIRESESGQTDSAFFLEILQTARLERTTSTALSEIVPIRTLNTPIDVSLGTVGHLRVRHTV